MACTAWSFALAAAALALAGCGLLDPPGPPARLLDPAPGASGDSPQPSAPDYEAPPFPGYALAWRDEFDGTALDERWWTIDLGRWRSGLNARDAIQVKDGLLSFVTYTDDAGFHHAGHINTVGTYEPTYGYFEARIRFLDSVGQWCSFFIYPRTIGNPVGDPGTAGVEIDVFEHRDVDAAGFDLRQMIQVGLNWDGFGPDWKRVNQLLAHPRGEPLSHAWHTYATLWTDSLVTFYVDRIPVWSTSAALSHRAEPIYLCCEVLDADWAGFIPAGGYGTLATTTSGMEVDWVRVWQAAP
jgi:beta-glucanase (GH16 family)